MFAEKGIAPGQLALAWVLARGADFVPIPGTKHLRENAAAVDVPLSPEDLTQLGETAPKDVVAGDCCPSRELFDPQFSLDTNTNCLN